MTNLPPSMGRILLYRSENGERLEESVVRLFRTTDTDGKVYEVAHYNLHMIIALGVRVRSAAAVRFSLP